MFDYDITDEELEEIFQSLRVKNGSKTTLTKTYTKTTTVIIKNEKGVTNIQEQTEETNHVKVIEEIY